MSRDVEVSTVAVDGLLVGVALSSCRLSMVGLREFAVRDGVSGNLIRVGDKAARREDKDASDAVGDKGADLRVLPGRDRWLAFDGVFDRLPDSSTVYSKSAKANSY